MPEQNPGSQEGRISNQRTLSITSRASHEPTAKQRTCREEVSRFLSGTSAVDRVEAPRYEKANFCRSSLGSRGPGDKNETEVTLHQLRKIYSAAKINNLPQLNRMFRPIVASEYSAAAQEADKRAVDDPDWSRQGTINSQTPTAVLYVPPRFTTPSVVSYNPSLLNTPIPSNVPQEGSVMQETTVPTTASQASAAGT